MRVNNEERLPYLFHENCFHVFDLVYTIDCMYSGMFPGWAIGQSVSSIKIYMFQNIIHYNQSTGTMRRDSYTEDEMVRYAITLLENVSYMTVNYRTTKFMFIVDKYGEKGSIREKLSRHIANPRIIGIRWYDNWACQYRAETFNKSHLMMANLYINTQQLTVVMSPTAARKGLTSQRGLDLVCPFYNSKLVQDKMPIVTVEDYVKWYDLYCIVYGGGAISSWDIPGAEFARDIDQIDHAPNPRSVVEACDKHGMHLDFISYIAICCRWSEDVYLDDSQNEMCASFELPGNQESDLPSAELLGKVLVFNQCSMCHIYGFPWTLNDGVLNALLRRELKNWYDLYRRAVTFDK